MLALKFSLVVLILSSFLILVTKCQYDQFYDSTQNMVRQHNIAIQQAQNQMPGLMAIAPTTTTSHPRGDEPDTCDTSYDAIALIRSEVFIFKGKYMWRINSRGLQHGYPVLTTSFWDLPKDLTHVDAVYERLDKKIVFFIGRNYYLFNANRLVSGYPKDISTLGLPEILDNIDGAMVWGKNNKTYFFSGTMYWRYDEDSQKVELDYPRDMAIWKGVGYYIDDVFQWKDGATYFFKGKGFWKFNDLLMRVTNETQTLSAPFWMGCPDVTHEDRNGKYKKFYNENTNVYEVSDDDAVLDGGPDAPIIVVRSTGLLSRTKCVNNNCFGFELHTTRPEAECKESVTTVNGVKEKCAGRLIFSSDFNDGISRNWSNVVLLNDDIKEDEFTVFDNDRRNIYTDEGSLVIKPKLLNEEYGDGFPVYGKLDLKGCTSDSRKNCEKEAIGAQILPPVVSARITTKNSFSFRYGFVEINAKLPRGDWVVPELWLLPKYRLSGKNSGKIVIAQSLGNDDLKFYGSIINNAYCVTRLFANGKRSDIDMRKANGSWSDGYTSFQIGWHPNGISFGINDNIENFWNSTTREIFMKGESDKIAPFNEEFYLVLGVHVGGVAPYEFPDDIINRGRSKPWKNNAASRMMQFYEDRENWLSTWDERTALRVDSVKVWSL